MAEVILGFNLTDVTIIKTHLQSLSNIKSADLVNLVRMDNLLMYTCICSLLYTTAINVTNNREHAVVCINFRTNT